MQRLCFSFQIHPDKAGEYRRRHDEIWPELVADLKAAGLCNYSLFRLGEDRIVGYVEGDPDPRACLARMAGSEASARWNAWFEDVIVSLTDEEGNLHELEEVWHLD
jgi:L-rhamnose mutarotase